MLAEKHVSVQVSLNGSRAELHDSICGKGNFERTMAGLQRLLSKHANMVIVRNMMNKQNMNDNWDMFCEKLIDMGVHKIMLAGLKKVGRANENLEKIALTPLEYQSLIDRLKESKVITGINDEYRKLAGDEAESTIRTIFLFHILAFAHMYTKMKTSSNKSQNCYKWRRVFVSIVYGSTVLSWKY